MLHIFSSPALENKIHAYITLLTTFQCVVLRLTQAFFGTFRKKLKAKKTQAEIKLKQIFKKLKQIIQKLNNLPTKN